MKYIHFMHTPLLVMWMLLIGGSNTAAIAENQQEINLICRPFTKADLSDQSSDICVQTSWQKGNSFFKVNASKKRNVEVDSQCACLECIVSQLRDAVQLGNFIGGKQKEDLAGKSLNKGDKQEDRHRLQSSKWCEQGECLQFLSLSPGEYVTDSVESGFVYSIEVSQSQVGSAGISKLDLRCQDLLVDVNSQCISPSNPNDEMLIEELKFMIYQSQSLFHEKSCLNNLLSDTLYGQFLNLIHGFQGKIQRDSSFSSRLLLDDQTDNNQSDSSNQTDTNSNNDNRPAKENEKKQDGSDSSSSSTTTFIVIGVIASLLILGCCGGIIYIRRNNDSGFASLTANIESDKQRMIKPGGMMSMGSGSNSSNSSGNGSTSNSNNNQNQLQDGENRSLSQNKNPKKFSNRVTNSSASSKSGKEKQFTDGNNNNSLKQYQDIHSAIELKLDSNHTQNVAEHLKNHTKQNGIADILKEENISGNLETTEQGKVITKDNKTRHARATLQHSSSSPDNEQIQSVPPPPAEGLNGQPQDPAKHLDTSVQNNFFCIDGEEQEKHDKIMDSIESDDTTFSNVFNLEGEESCKPHTNRRKKKQKKENHLFFEDVNQEQ